MNDLKLDFGDDLQISNTGDLQAVDGLTFSEQRVVQRLLTNPAIDGLLGDYLWHQQYGAGLPREVGAVLTSDDEQRLKSLILSQLFEESTVARTPEPTLSFSFDQNNFICMLKYTNAVMNSPQVVTIRL